MPGNRGTAGRDPVAMTKVLAVEPAAVHFERVGCHEPAVAEDDVDTEAAEAFGAVVGLDARDDAGDALHDLGEVRLRRDGWQRPAVGLAHLVGDPRRFDQRLGRHAAVPEAIAAEPVLFDEGDLGAQRRAAGGDDEPARTAADHHDVEFGFCHDPGH